MNGNIGGVISPSISSTSVGGGYSSGWGGSYQFRNNPVEYNISNVKNVVLDSTTVENVSFEDVAGEDSVISAITDFLGAGGNGLGLAFIEAGKGVFKSVPAASLVLMFIGMSLSSGSDGFEWGSNTAYALYSCTPAETWLKDFMVKRIVPMRGPSGAALSGATVVNSVLGNFARQNIYGTIALTVMNVVVALSTGSSPKEVLEKSPQLLLESTVWTIVSNCVGAIAGPIVGTTAASIATMYCTKPFTDEFGNVDQGWCIAAEVGVVAGAASGFVIAAAAGLTAAGPIGWVVLGCALVGYLSVVGIKALVDHTEAPLFNDSWEHYWDNVPEDAWLTGF